MCWDGDWLQLFLSARLRWKSMWECQLWCCRVWERRSLCWWRCFMVLFLSSTVHWFVCSECILLPVIWLALLRKSPNSWSLWMLWLCPYGMMLPVMESLRTCHWPRASSRSFLKFSALVLASAFRPWLWHALKGPRKFQGCASVKGLPMLEKNFCEVTMNKSKSLLGT